MTFYVGIAIVKRLMGTFTDEEAAMRFVRENGGGFVIEATKVEHIEGDI
jgi:hypothetical protein